MSEIPIKTDSILSPLDPPPFIVEREEGKSRYIIICDHAVNRIPVKNNDLGVKKVELEQHIALDIGALDTAVELSVLTDSPLIYTSYSRLVIDVNRPPGSVYSIPEIADGISVPGNRNLSPPDREKRENELFYPYHMAISGLINSKISKGINPVLIAVHSFTPVMNGFSRPWPVSVSYDKSFSFARGMIHLLKNETPGPVGDNEPYAIDRETDYTIPVHGDDRDIPSALIEIRQDKLYNKGAPAEWAGILAGILTAMSDGDYPVGGEK